MELIEIKDSTKQSFLRELFRISHECINSTPAYTKGAVISDPFQTFLYAKTGRKDYDSLLDLFKRTLVSSESNFAYSAQICLLMCAKLHEMKITDIDAIESFIKNDFDLSARQKLTRSDLASMWRSRVGSDLDPSWIDLLKIDSSFECKLTKSIKSQVVVQQGHNFKNVRLHESFVSIGKVKQEDCDLLVIDGIVDTEGEIFSTIESSRKSNRATFIVAAGFSQDVAVHLLKNYMMGSFKVIPLICATQDDPIGVLVDLSAATGCEIISSIKGDTLSGSHERCRASLKSISATNSGSLIEVRNKSDKLQARIEELQRVATVVNGSEGQRYISERISSLRGSLVRVFISEFENNKNPGLISRIDAFMRSLQPMTKMGTISIAGQKFPSLSTRESILAFSSFISCLRSLQIIMETM
jgi:hypothetical protein